ncbi:hypothetical protein CRUP_032484 [Coryphaenoides rupestris]|nr:hypothetical protein CRUP_032484 [Coryphaenoides rupestris]
MSVYLAPRVRLALEEEEASSSSSSSSSSSCQMCSRGSLFNLHCRRYELDRSCCFSALLLDEERGRLFVGAKNFLISLSLENIGKQEHTIYWPAPVDWREECNWAGKDINLGVSVQWGLAADPGLEADRGCALVDLYLEAT